MFGFSLATPLFQGSTQRTWNCVSHLVNLIWGKFNYIRKETMPRSRKRHHSRSRSRSRSFSPDRSYDRHKKIDSHEKDGKRRKVDDVDSPLHKRSISSERHNSTENEVHRIEDVNEQVAKVHDKLKTEGNVDSVKETAKSLEVIDQVSGMEQDDNVEFEEKSNEASADKNLGDEPVLNVEEKDHVTVDAHDEVNTIIESTNGEDDEEKTPAFNTDDAVVISDSDSSKLESKVDAREKLATPKCVTPKQIQKKLESEKKKLQKQKEREEREKQKQEEKAKILAEKDRIRQQKEAEKQKLLEEKQKLQEQRQKEKEMKEEQKRKEKEEKEQKRKEKEEQEAQKRKEKELEKLKKQQDIEDKNKEKQREEEKKQKTAAMFVGFFKKTETEEKEKKTEKANCNFMPFEIKSDMRLPPMRRSPLCTESVKKLDLLIKSQDENASYLNDLKSGVIKIGKAFQTWPYEDSEDDVTIIEDDKSFGETICEKTAKKQNLKAKFLLFHDNRRPAYFGTWRKKSKFIKPRRPFEEDTDIFNYDEDSDDDWEEEEQGESLDVSGDDEEKENDAEDDYEVDNEFFVPHGHLSDDEIDDEENARLSPESLKQKLKLLKDEFDEEIKSKTHKLKSRSIGCIWYNNNGDNVEDAIKKYLQPFAMIVNGQIEIKKRSEIFATSPEKKKLKTSQELPLEHVPYFLKIIHGNANKMKTIIEQFLTYMGNNGLKVETSKVNLKKFLKQIATYKRCTENGPMKNKFGWFVNDGVNEKYEVNLDLSKSENSSC